MATATAAPPDRTKTKDQPAADGRLAELRGRIKAKLREIGTAAESGPDGWMRVTELEILLARLESVAGMFRPPG